ncbi:Short-chain dehydrogenase [Roseivivax lentus]|uniref:Short-chain dehydrogenase n=1 Tax=Roseivivax lentus TaxID=633194 RepID=A0A1N7PXL0_9RHOB|nr:SDR family oxidoreductase [Roseivivax lentus]SIT15348.1 Short-chain dehydrogenase [Roseivivax lentus]
MKPFLTGRVVLVTGASKGLGAGTARVMARAGAHVVATARDGDALNAVVADIRSEGAQAVAIPADLSEDASVAALVAATTQAGGRIDALVNIAGLADGIGTKLWNIPVDTVERLNATNITGVFNVLRHVVPVMQTQHGGRLLFLSSPATFNPQPETGAYAATKAAVNQIVQTLALELNGSGVTVNAFNPGPVDTPLYGQISSVLSRGGMSPAGRPPELAAQLLLWLCAPETATLNGEFVQWDNPNTLAAMDDFQRSYHVSPRG